MQAYASTVTIRCTEVAWQALTTPALGELQEVDMRGKTVLITGATSGLGLWQAEAGCHLCAADAITCFSALQVLARWNASLILPAFL